MLGNRLRQQKKMSPQLQHQKDIKGVSKISLPKVEEAKRKKIEIKGS
jgi:hypothetical protein